MKIFISWSGEHSNQVAKALSDWLPLVFQSVSVWVSSEHIQAGSRWAHEVSTKLDESDVGILYLTASNLSAPWILFEAGALV